MLLPKRSLLGALAALAIVAAACSGTDITAVATVNGEPIELEDVRALRVSYQDGDVETNTEQFRTDLGRLIFTRAIVEAAAGPEMGIVVTDAEIAERLANPPRRYQVGFASVVANPDLTNAVLEREALTSLIADRVLVKLLAEEEGYLAGLLQDSPATFASACVRHILVDNIFQANTIIEQLNDGGDFVALAAEFSTDTTNAQEGGLLADDSGCLLPLSNWVPEFGNAAALAEIGEIVGPVQSSFGYHVIRVDERSPLPTLADLEADPLSYIPDIEYSRFFTPWFNTALRASEITVNPLVGTWFEDGLGILPPDDG